jgi:SAM-dependent methyltransferase
MVSITQLPIPGGWTERNVIVGPRTFRLLTPADPDQLLDHLAEPLDKERPHLADPYWAKLWPAATFLAEAVWRLREDRGQKTEDSRQQALSTNGSPALAPSPQPLTPCLELGCGCGLVGLAALAAGWQVTFSDYVPQAVELALENAARNGLDGARGLVLDWRDPPSGQFPFIVASDVTYDRANLAPLLNTLDRMLAPGGEAWLGDAGRGPAADFLRLARGRGWSVSLLDKHDRPASEPALGRCQRIVLRRPAGQ